MDYENGIVFVPGSGEPQASGSTGVTVHGTRTHYPSLEVYQEYENGHINVVAIDPAVTAGEHGPLANLPFHHTIPNSDPNIMDRFEYIQEYPGDQPPGSRTYSSSLGRASDRRMIHR